MKRNFFVNLIEGTVDVDPCFLEKAGEFGTPEFEKFMELKKTLPDFKFIVKKLNDSDKNTYPDLTYEVMEAFINFYEPAEKRADAISEFCKVRAESVFKKAPYSYTKSWFLKKHKEAYNKSSFAEKRKGKKVEAIRKLNDATAVSVQ